MAAIGFLMLMLVIPIKLAHIFLSLLPVGIIIFSILGAVLFLAIESFVRKKSGPVLQKVLPGREDTAAVVRKIITVVLKIIKISMAVFAWVLLAGFMALFKETAKSILVPLLAAVSVQAILFVIMKLARKRTAALTNLFFLIEPYVLTLVILGIAWGR